MLCGYPTGSVDYPTGHRVQGFDTPNLQQMYRVPVTAFLLKYPKYHVIHHSGYEYIEVTLRLRGRGLQWQLVHLGYSQAPASR